MAKDEVSYKREQYFKKLKKLISNPPEGVLVRYDYMSCELYLVDSNAKFIDEEPKGISAIVGSTTPQNGQGYGGSTGYEKELVIGSIYVNMEAKQN